MRLIFFSVHSPIGDSSDNASDYSPHNQRNPNVPIEAHEAQTYGKKD